MRTADEIINFTDAIAANFPVEKIVLFGSYAYGQPTNDSDVDLLVIKRYRGDAARASTRIWAKAKVWYALDLLVRSPAEVRRRLEMNDWFMRDIIEKGLVLHDAHDLRMGQKSRKRLRQRLHASSVQKSESV